jgi:rod shape determining protein RodA
MKPISTQIPIPNLLGASEPRPALSGLSGLDWGILAATVLLAGIGLAFVHSASEGMATDYLPRQAMWMGIGVVLLLVALTVNYHSLIDLAAPIYAAGLFALVVVLVFGAGPGGTRSWLVIGDFRLGQPAEFAKLGTTLFLARYLSGINRRFLTLRQIAVAALIVAMPMGLIALQPDLGSAAMFVPMATGMVLIAGVRLRLLAAAVVATVLLGAGVWSFGMKSYQRQRVITFLAPESDPLGAGYQVRQSKIAVGSGGLAGKGYMQGTQSQLRFLPARHTDFIFAVLAEEWGFLGAAAVLGLYALYIVSALRIALRARDRGGILLVVGLIAVFAFHVVYNTAMVVGLLPITGIPLPFLSYGGSFTLVNFLATGLILAVDVQRYVNR